MNYHVLSCIIMYYHELSCIIMNYHVLSCIIMYYHVLSCIIMNYYVIGDRYGWIGFISLLEQQGGGTEICTVFCFRDIFAI